MPSELLVGNGIVCTLGSEKFEMFPDHGVFVVGDTIQEIGPTNELQKKHSGAQFVDAQGMLIMPGFICGHAHFYGMYSRGMALKDEPPTNFVEILERLWWRLDKALYKESIYYSAMVCCIAAIKAGTTCIIDHHASPSFIDTSLDSIAEATLEAGVRSNLCYEVTDRNGKEGTIKGIAENVRFIERCRKEKNPLLAASFGLHASFTVSEETLKECKQALDKLKESDPSLPVGFHIHLAEGEYDEKHSIENYGMRTTHRLHKAGILGPHSIAGHGVFLNEEEMDILKNTGTLVVSNPESNMNNAVGVPNVLLMLKKGIPVGLGTDGMTFDMFQEYKCNYLIHKFNAKDPRVCGGESLEMLTKQNSLIASRLFPKPVGKLEPGAFADIVLMDYQTPTPLTPGNFPWHVQFGMNVGHVDTTIIGGKIMMQGKKLSANLNETEIMRKAKELAPKVWEAV